MSVEVKPQTNQWQSGMAKNITFIVTKDCQLACKYCYLVGKNTEERMSWSVAKKAIDYILDHEEDFCEESVIWDFIGGEPFLEIELIDTICDYIKQELFRRNHHWFNSYRFSFSTNGINYHTDKVQQFIRKNRSHLSIGITIDGTKQKHDLNRIWKQTPNHLEERGSYDDVVKNIALWQSQFPGSGTKVTISSADIPYIKDSVIHLFSLGIHEVNINCVFENVWKEGDDKLFEEQLVQLADVIIAKGYYKDYVCSFFNERIGQHLHDNNNWCGAGKMLAIDAQGNFYPCTRFAQYSLREKKAWTIGDINSGIDLNKLRPFLALNRCTQSSQECIDCDVAEGCAWCQGENYDAADTPTIYQRSTAICKMHKARVRANNYYWNKLALILENDQLRKHFVKMSVPTGLIKSVKSRMEYLVIILDDTSTSYCHYSPRSTPRLISIDALKAGIDFALKENLNIQFVFPDYPVPEEYQEIIQSVLHSTIKPFNVETDAADIVVASSLSQIRSCSKCENSVYILRMKKAHLLEEYDIFNNLLGRFKRLNLVVLDIDTFTQSDFNDYDYILKKWANQLYEYYKEHRVLPQVNVLTDRIVLNEMNNCNAGDKSITLAPDGNFYVCPAFYYANTISGSESTLTDICQKGFSIGNIVGGLDIKNQYLYKIENAPICSNCDAYQCKRCVWINRKKTLEINTPSSEQCISAHVERNVSADLLRLLKKEKLFENVNMNDTSYYDPINLIN